MSSSLRKRVSLVWFKNNDLRLHDHLPLLDAHRSSDHVIHLMVVDKFWSHGTTRVLGIPKLGPFRCKFLKESILDLRHNLQALGSQLIIRYGHSSAILPSVVSQYHVDRVYYHDELHSEEKAIVDDVISKCHDTVTHHVQFMGHWGGNTLYHPDDLPWSKQTMKGVPETFTGFRKAVERKIAIRDPAESLTKKLCRPHPKFQEIGRLQTLKQLGCDVDSVEMDERSCFPFSGGERAALQRLNHYVWGDGGNARSALVTYKKTRNESVGTEYSTKFSAFLSSGNLSPRLVYSEIKQFERSTGISNESTYWVVFELLWRDFFKFACLKYGDKVFHLHGPYGKVLYKGHRGWSRDMKIFNKFCDGQTGYPFIDAAMIELRQTGAMSNRLRQNVASFLIKDLGMDWRFGAEWFESWLMDYDAASNYGNWNYIAGIGFDPQSGSRYFNIHKQAHNYDRNGDYVKLWLPQLSGVSKQFVHKPYEMNRHQQEMSGVIVGADYPSPCQSLRPPNGAYHGGSKRHWNNSGKRNYSSNSRRHLHRNKITRYYNR